MKLVPTPIHKAAELEPDSDVPPVGSWWWVTSDGERDDYDEPDKRWLACVTEVGSNYAKVEGVRLQNRIALDHFHDQCTPEPEHAAYIATKVGFHQHNVRGLMGQIQRLCHQLGVPLHQALEAAPAEATSQALAVVHGTADVEAHRKALVQAKEKTLPELFAKVKAQHEAMAMWMKAELIPAKAELAAATEVTKKIGDKIHTVELYAGLTEQLVQVRKGKAAPNDTKVHLMQRRHYMDEECLVRYEAGGMSFADIGAFDQWLKRDENFRRLLPHDRTLLAFRVRRHARQGDGTLETFIKLWFESEANRKTYLYIRNGEQLWRMETSIDFDEELFPLREDSELLGDGELWIQPGARDMLITGKEHARRQLAYRETKRVHALKLAQWKKAGSPKGHWTYAAVENDDHGWELGTKHKQTGKPSFWFNHGDASEGYELLTPENIYYDDAMKRVRRAAFEHNRIAVIVQGLLDRSTCLHPHPPWRIWTPEGFAASIELVYDVSRAVTGGAPLDWETYRAQLNKSLKPGVYTIGQYKAWTEAMADRYGHKWQDYVPGNDRGPARIARVQAIKRGKAIFHWTRERSWRSPVWVPSERAGYIKKSYPDIEVSWACELEHLTCISAYTPGDFHLFYDDPRTREQYLEWAPILLRAEDWHHKRRNAKEESESE